MVRGTYPHCATDKMFLVIPYLFKKKKNHFDYIMNIYMYNDLDVY